MTSHPAIAAALRDWRAARAEYQVYLESQVARAEADIGPYLVNARGRARHVSSHSLFMGPWHVARAYASPELLEWWDTHPRLTFAAWEAQHGLAPGRQWGHLIRDTWDMDPAQEAWESGCG